VTFPPALCSKISVAEMVNDRQHKVHGTLRAFATAYTGDRKMELNYYNSMAWNCCIYAAFFKVRIFLSRKNNHWKIFLWFINLSLLHLEI
jgi:hypothetical protein